jgi:hypothetical protein
MPLIYGRSDPTDDPAPFDLSSAVPDVVVTMMGGNDYSMGIPADNGAPTQNEFTGAYRAFVVGTLRASYPNAHLFLTVSPSVSDADRNARTIITNTVQTIASERNAAGDSRVYAFLPAVAQASELTACNGHGTPAFHERVANELAAQIVAKVPGWL